MWRILKMQEINIQNEQPKPTVSISAVTIVNIVFLLLLKLQQFLKMFSRGSKLLMQQTRCFAIYFSFFFSNLSQLRMAC